MTGFADTIDDVFPFVGNPELEPPKAREWFATQSQQAGLVRLNALADLFGRIGDSKPGSFQPLLRCLLIGGTGVGKSTLACEFARQRSWDYTSVDCGSWIIQGAYSKPSTLRLLRDMSELQAGPSSTSMRCARLFQTAWMRVPGGTFR